MIHNFYFLDINIFKSHSIYIYKKKRSYSCNLRLILLFIVIFYLKIIDFIWKSLNLIKMDYFAGIKSSTNNHRFLEL
jgi:hypothetical protein